MGIDETQRVPPKTDVQLDSRPLLCRRPKVVYRHAHDGDALLDERDVPVHVVRPRPLLRPSGRERKVLSDPLVLAESIEALVIDLLQVNNARTGRILFALEDCKLQQLERLADALCGFRGFVVEIPGDELDAIGRLGMVASPLLLSRVNSDMFPRVMVVAETIDFQWLLCRGFAVD